MRALLQSFVLLSALSLSSNGAVAQQYPDKPVKIIVAYQAGQGTDAIARYIADHLSKSMGQAFFIENRGGAGGNIGTYAAARAPADGYTLTMGTNATHNLNAFLYPNLNFDPVQDFEPITLIGSFPMVVLTKPDSELHTIKDLLEHAEQKKQSADIGLPSTTARLVLELLKEQTGAPLFGVMYKGSGMAMNNLIGGDIGLTIDTYAAARPQLDGATLRAIAVTSKQDSPLLPQVPTVASQGLPDFEVIAWNALFAPKGTPPEIIEKLSTELQQLLTMPETRERLLALGLDIGGGSPQDLASMIQAEQAKWGPIIEKAGISIQ